MLILDFGSAVIFRDTGDFPPGLEMEIPGLLIKLYGFLWKKVITTKGISTIIATRDSSWTACREAPLICLLTIIPFLSLCFGSSISISDRHYAVGSGNSYTKTNIRDRNL